MNMTERAAQKRTATENKEEMKREAAGGRPFMPPLVSGREGERRGRERENTRALLSPESITWTSRVRTNTQGPDPEKGRRGGETDQTHDTENLEGHKRHPETEAETEKDLKTS